LIRRIGIERNFGSFSSNSELQRPVILRPDFGRRIFRNIQDIIAVSVALWPMLRVLGRRAMPAANQSDTSREILRAKEALRMTDFLLIPRFAWSFVLRMTDQG
jgi:hypothetical protein